MRLYRFLVYFSKKESVEVIAFDLYEAVVLAQAPKIKDGLNFNILKIENADTGKAYKIYKYTTFKHYEV
jgi:hypothetical protein